ncbi:MAG: sigma 54-interacting transcriptional regulator [Deltaproteobacteria bacterium]|nr:sigma 54-interacting transcriptional regulator [Deltaproteobacteria bacterium]
MSKLRSSGGSVDEATWVGQTEVDPAHGTARVRVLQAFVPGQTVRIELPPVVDTTMTLTLGRSRENDVVLLDPTVSRQHALLVLRGSEVFVQRVAGSRGPIRVGESLMDGVEPVQIALGAPFALGDIVVIVREERRAPMPRTGSTPESGILHRSASMRAVLSLLARVADSPMPALVLGETGTGKELIARALHDGSSRARMAFLAVNCAALPAHLLEAELFGFERGAFSGAVASKPGLFEAAHKGTLLLDEVGELSMDVQAKLLRVLETGELLRLGSVKPRSVDVRVVSATHRDLASMVESGTFRRDLYYRIQGVTLTLPPLRERVDDIDVLAVHFARAVLRGAEPTFGVGVLEALRAYPWPGNVRELRTVIERSVLLSGNAHIEVGHLQLNPIVHPPQLASRPTMAPAAPSRMARPAPGERKTEQSLKDELRALEHARIADALEECGGNQSQAAILLGMPRRTLVARLAELGLTKGSVGKTRDEE